MGLPRDRLNSVPMLTCVYSQKCLQCTRQGCPLSPLIFNLIMEPLAEHIRLHRNITGFKIGHIEHKINLFADDVVMMLTNPISSLASVQDVLMKFSCISYYKVNATKSYILDLGLDAVTSNILRNQYVYPWAETGISYLGITLTKSTKGLFNSNYIDTKQMLLQETAKLAKFEISWSGRLAAFKMLILPKILYTFRTLPIPLSNSYLNSLQTIISRYIWQNKKPRSSHSKIIKHRLVGGMGYPDIRDYYLATILSQLQEWTQTHQNTLWGNIENNATPGPNLACWLYSTSAQITNTHLYSPTIQASVKAWKILHNTKWLSLTTKPIHVPIQTLRLLSPDLTIPNWLLPQTSTTEELRNTIQHKPFTVIQSTHKAPTSDFLTYLRIQSCLSRNPSIEGSLPNKLWSFYFTQESQSKGISIIYSTLQEKNTFNKSKPFTDWETDTHEQFSDQQWTQALKTVHKATRCTSLWELTNKITLRWYLTPLKLAKFQTNSSALCWRQCNHTGTLLHILWHCPIITNLWKEVTHLIQDIGHFNITLTPQLAILNMIPDTIPHAFKTILTHILLATRLLLTRNWKTHNVPTILEVITLVHSHYTYELIGTRGSASHHKIQANWSQWKNWYNSRIA